MKGLSAAMYIPASARSLDEDELELVDLARRTIDEHTDAGPGEDGIHTVGAAVMAADYQRRNCSGRRRPGRGGRPPGGRWPRRYGGTAGTIGRTRLIRAAGYRRRPRSCCGS